MTSKPEPSAFTQAAAEAGDMHFFVLMAALDSGQIWCYPAGRKDLMTQDHRTVVNWYTKGADIKMMKGYGFRKPI